MTDWRDEALCAQVGGEIFFPEPGESTEPARSVCRDCPVVNDCREYAITRFIKHGIWGGTSGRQREQIRARRRREAREAAA